VSYLYAGIDYSMTAPAITILKNKTTFEHYYITSTKKYSGHMAKDIYGFLMPEYSCNEERFDIIGNWAMKILQKHKIQDVCLEGYAMGATGKVFHIGENTGVLKNKLFKNGNNVIITPPTSIKAFARSYLAKDDQKDSSGKLVKMDKEQMVKTYIHTTGRDIYKLMGTTSSSGAINDICDSFFMSLYVSQNI